MHSQSLPSPPSWLVLVPPRIADAVLSPASLLYLPESTSSTRQAQTPIPTTDSQDPHNANRSDPHDRVRHRRRNRHNPASLRRRPIQQMDLPRPLKSTFSSRLPSHHPANHRRSTSRATATPSPSAAAGAYPTASFTSRAPPKTPPKSSAAQCGSHRTHPQPHNPGPSTSPPGRSGSPKSI